MMVRVFGVVWVGLVLSVGCVGVVEGGGVAKHLVHIVVDDLRPELPLYGWDDLPLPNLRSLFSRSTVFRHAYCQVAVCAPSRQSFLSGRHANTTRAWNFIDHLFTPRVVGGVEAGVNYFGHDLYSFPLALKNGSTSSCMTACSFDEACTHWTYNTETQVCWLKTSDAGRRTQSNTISGASPEPTVFTDTFSSLKSQNFLSLGTGKLWHSEEAGILPRFVPGTPGCTRTATPPSHPSWVCIGLPPAHHPPSFSNSTTQFPPQNPYDGGYVIPDMQPCPPDPTNPTNGKGCALDVPKNGSEGDFCDYAIVNDAISKLNFAAQQASSNHSRFVLGIGIRKPHLPFRSPAFFYDQLPPLNDTPLAKYPTLDPSIPPWSFHDVQWKGVTPTTPMPDLQARSMRKFYRASIAWMDYNVGRIIRAINQTGLQNETAIILHADHGWNLGENGKWRKFDESEDGTRVPLAIHVPSLPQSHGRVVQSVVELTDLFRTSHDILGATLPASDTWPVEGASLVPVLSAGSDGEAEAEATRLHPLGALSMYPRCPSNESVPWRDNWCEFVDRSQFAAMGLAVRSNEFRYVEWRRWNASALEPHWGPEGLLATELYDHRNDKGLLFDIEPKNQAQQFPNVAAQMAQVVRTSFNGWV